MSVHTLVGRVTTTFTWYVDAVNSKNIFFFFLSEAVENDERGRHGGIDVSVM